MSILPKDGAEPELDAFIDKAGTDDQEKQSGVDQEQLDAMFDADELNETKSDFRGTFGNSMLSFIGAGMLSLPYAFRQVGLLCGTLSMLVVGVLCLYAMILLIECKYIILTTTGRKIVSYGDIGGLLFGKAGEGIINIAIAISQVGFAISYLLFIGSNVHSEYGIDEHTVVFCCMPVLVLLSWIPDMKSLAPLSGAAIGSNFFGQFVVYIFAFQVLFTTGPPPEIEYIWTNTSLPFFIGVCVYCYEGVAMVLLVEDAAKDKRGFKGTLTIVVVVYTVACVAFGAIGYMAFGEATADVITLNLGETTFSLLTKVSLCVGLYFTFPMMMYPPTGIVEKLLLGAAAEGKNATPTTAHCKLAIRSSMVLMTGAIAVGCPGFGDFISLVGSSICALLALVLPAIFHIVLVTKQGGKEVSAFAMGLDLFVLIFGIAFGVLGTLDAVERLVGAAPANAGAA
jgi:proton-coupled amino acid transporter